MNQVAKKEKSDVALTSMFEQDQAGGMEGMGSGDFAMPFLRVLGQLSPEVNKRDAKYVEGAEPGMIFNTVTRQTYDGETGVNLVPCGLNGNKLNGQIVARALVLQLRFTRSKVVS